MTSKLPIAASSRSCCTGTPRTLPDAAQATAASSSSGGGPPSPSMQRRRAAPPRGPSLWLRTACTSEPKRRLRSACRTACTSTMKP
eukprot:scaffold29024_cov51-Phaeocystis_antarctica.AAC.3